MSLAQVLILRINLDLQEDIMKSLFNSQQETSISQTDVTKPRN